LELHNYKKNDIFIDFGRITNLFLFHKEIVLASFFKRIDYKKTLMESHKDMDFSVTLDFSKAELVG
jgi:hypothetical protein